MVGVEKEAVPPGTVVIIDAIFIDILSRMNILATDIHTLGSEIAVVLDEAKLSVQVGTKT